MRPQKVKDQALLEGLLSIIRSKGYDGSNLNELAKAAGLQKASLYHRFPGGKKEITKAVLEHVGSWTKKHIYDLLTDEELDANTRLTKVIESISALYQEGRASCILRALSMDSSIKLFNDEIKKSMQHWIEGFTALGISFGYDPKVSKSKAFQVLVSVQGSLVVAKGLDAREVFLSTLESIRQLYQK